MITFRQKEFTEYDAMKAFYNELCRLTDRNRFPICTKSELPSILKGNNVVIEKFVIASPFFGRDVYRMYIRVGLKAKMPEAIRLTDRQYDKRLGDFQVNLKSGNLFDSQERNYSEILEQREFKGGGGYPFWKPQMSADFRPDRDAMSISYLVKESLGEAIVNDKKTRTVVLEFKSIQDAIRVLNLLPFGLNYKIYILDA
jgi:hypothetical protein